MRSIPKDEGKRYLYGHKAHNDEEKVSGMQEVGGKSTRKRARWRHNYYVRDGFENIFRNTKSRQDKWILDYVYYVWLCVTSTFAFLYQSEREKGQNYITNPTWRETAFASPSISIIVITFLCICICLCFCLFWETEPHGDVMLHPSMYHQKKDGGKCAHLWKDKRQKMFKDKRQKKKFKRQNKKGNI